MPLSLRLTKYAKTLIEPNDVRYELEKAVYLATTGRRGPVWLDFPLDVQATMVDETKLRGFTPEPVADVSDQIKQKVAAAIELLKKAERPVLFVGNGTRQAHLEGVGRGGGEPLKIADAVDMEVDGHAARRPSVLRRPPGVCRFAGSEFHAAECGLDHGSGRAAGHAADCFQPQELCPRPPRRCW